ncbi:TatD family hydrolase [Candidatus Saccharibacteria bacterium]|nr:TatD family hydrolase [Candidatus Saccharibacteria bacterium]
MDKRYNSTEIYLIDTHCHLHDRDFFKAAQAEEMIKRANERNVRKIICIGTSHEDSLAARDFANAHDNVYWTYGIHPSEVKQKTETYDFQDKPIAIGEVGLDYHSEGYNREAQIKLFEQMLQLASDNNLPVSFHVREAFPDFFAVMANFPKIRGVVHSFSDNKKNLKRILNETNFYIGVNGMATYSTLPTPPLERILLETDAPFLTPVPFRGIINEPAYVRAVAEWLSPKLGQGLEIIERETTKNAKKLFGF